MPEVEIPHPQEVHEKAENPFTRGVALAVAVYAVGLAVATFGGHNAAKEMMMAKAEESNQWNRYQSKSTRAALYKLHANLLQAERGSDEGRFPPAKAKLLDDLAKEEARMVADMKEIMDGGADNGGHGARHYQAEVRLMMRKDPYFDFAEVGFQLAIVLASVAMLSGRRWAFAASLGLAVLAALLTVNGFALVVAVPGLDPGVGP
jgi:hypothetical protein